MADHRTARRRPKILGALLAFCVSGLMAGVVLQPTPAPDWEMSAWLNDDPGSMRDQRGRVVLIGFFQFRCPGCKDFAVSLFQRWSALYGDREDVVIILVHSVFEAHDFQSSLRLREFVRETGISRAVGIDAYDDADGGVPVTLRRYRAGGTPYVAIVDKEGMLRFSHFGSFDRVPVERFIERLLEEPPGSHLRRLEPAAPAERFRPLLDAKISGTYLVRTDRATGVCTSWTSRVEVRAEMRVYDDEIDVEFTRPFFGIRDLKLRYETRTGLVEGEGQPPPAVTGGHSRSERPLRFEGFLDGRADPPKMEFELSFMDRRCAVSGRAHREP